jgi:hypothetical protein
MEVSAMSSGELDMAVKRGEVRTMPGEGRGAAPTYNRADVLKVAGIWG